VENLQRAILQLCGGKGGVDGGGGGLCRASAVRQRV
jgi:hypothetical protein